MHSLIILYSLLHNSNLASNRDVLLPSDLRECLDLHALPKQQTVTRPAEMEHADLIALLDMLPLLDRDLTCADLIHTDSNKRHEPNVLVIRLKENDCSRGQCRKVSLDNTDALRIRCLAVTGKGLREVSSVFDESALDDSRNGCVPAVVGEGGEEGLVDRATSKVLGQGVVGEHVEDGVRLGLDPELIAQMHVVGYIVDFRLAGVGDHGVVVGRGNRACLVVDLASEEVWNALVRDMSQE